MLSNTLNSMISKVKKSEETSTTNSAKKNFFQKYLAV